MKIKQCSRCREAKPVSEFYVNDRLTDGHGGKCKKCCAYYQMDYVNDNREKVRGYHREYQKELTKKKRANKEKTYPIPDGFQQIEGYPQYYISPLSEQVWSSIRRRFLTPVKINCGYYGVGLTNENGKKLVLIHRLLATAFVPNPNNYSWVNHESGDKLDNRISNLSWMTPKQNIQHAIRTGLFNPCQHGKNGPHLTIQQVLEIKEKKGVIPQTELAVIYDVSKSTIASIHQGKTWKNI
jgi:hypothetical protein